MFTPSQKRRLPGWATPNKNQKLAAWDSSGGNPGSKEEVKAATNNGVGKAKEEKASGARDESMIHETRAKPSVKEEDRPSRNASSSRPSVKDESKASCNASSSRVKEENVPFGGSAKTNVNTPPGIKEELDVVTDTSASKGKNIALSSIDVMEEELKILRGISELKSSCEFQAKVKEEPEEMVRAVPLIIGKSGGNNLSSDTEESKAMQERRQPLSESSRKKSHDALQRQNADSSDDNGRNSTSATHRVTTDNTRFQQYQNGKAQHKCPNVATTQGSNDVEKDTGVSLATQKAENGSWKPLARHLSKLFEGVTFTISGLVNPERAELRTMGVDMGARYRSSWSSHCTLLIAAFANTSTFNYVKALGGTIVHKDWVVECYKRRELVAIEEYMMHVGNPWRAGHDVDESLVIGVEKVSPSQTELVKAQNTETASDEHKKLLLTPTVDGTKTSKSKVPGMVRNKATIAEIQQWFLEDLETLRSWLEERHDKPEQEMLEYTAAQGLVACLEDAIRSLEGNEGLKLVLDSWAFIPRAIKELEKELCEVSDRERTVREAERIKSIYDSEIQKRGLGDPPKEDAQTDDDATEIISDTESRDPADYNSDDTADLSEDEITQCQIQIMSKFALD